jgi:uncharacterized protein (DUF1697 family)
MNTYITLLRGINVDGHKKVPMAKLREVISHSGFENVRTYTQSGNIILQSSEDNISKIESTIQQSIQSHFGFEVPVFVKTRTELQPICKTCPFSEEKKLNIKAASRNYKTMVKLLSLSFQN